MFKLSQVFGITASVPTVTYVDRAGLDGKFAHLLGVNRHIVIYGASKQGKTSLRRKQLSEGACVIIPCKPEHKLEDIYQEIRRQLNVKELVESRSTWDGGGKVAADAKGKGGIPFIAEAEAGGSLEFEIKHGAEKAFEHVTGAGSLVALAEAISKSNKRIIIEDFHYLSEEERRRLAFDLKALWDLKQFFLIVGVWAEQNLLTVYNNDLNGRVEEVDVQWSERDLRQVLEKGEEALNVIFDDNIKSAVVKDANGNVGLLQRLAEKICETAGIFSEQTEVALLDNLRLLDISREQICTSQENRYHAFVELISKGFKDPERTKLKMYHHLVRVCFEATDQELLNGIGRQTLLTRIQVYEKEANMSVLSAALSRLNRLQAERKFSPPVLAYNNIAQTISLVDREFLFFRQHTKRAWPWNLPDYEPYIKGLFSDETSQ